MPIEELLGPLPRGWIYTTLGKACAEGGGDLQTGPFGSQLHASDYVAGGIPTIMPQNIGDNRVVEEGIARILLEDAERLGRYRVRVGDIVYSRRGDVERRALIRERESGWLCGTGCLRVRFGDGDVDPLYASYYLGDNRVREWVVRHAHGATMPNLNTGILSALPFVVPPISQQRAIAHPLSIIDDKIALNRTMNETLEAIAQALFKSWFVDFDPVRAKAEGRDPGLPTHFADLFPDSFDEGKAGEVPKGWRIEPVRNCAEINTRVLRHTDSLEIIDYVEISQVMRGEIRSVTRYHRGSEPSRARRRLRHGDTVLSTVRPDRGARFICLDPPDTLIASTGFAVLSARDGNWAFLYAALSRRDVGEELGRLADGGAYPAVRPETIGALRLVHPASSALIDAFESVARPLYRRAEQNRSQSRTLATLRDTLLPKLLSGELRIKDSERFVGRHT
jgi:type I restriction enzyme S subunit